METGPGTVVAGVDGRPATLRAAVWAAREAARRDVALTLVAAVGAGGPRRVEVDLARARRMVGQAVEVPVTAEILPGPVGSALIAAGRDAELLVLGARTPDSQLDETVGTTTAQLLVGAACPVVVIPAAWEVERRHEGEVVVAADPSDPDAAARGPVALAADVAARWGTPLSAAMVLPREPGHREVARGRGVIDGVLSNVEGCRGSAGIDVIVRHGDAAAELLDLVGPPAALLVLGAHGAQGRDGAHGATMSPASTPGPTCQKVVRWARCPVAVVPPGVAGVRPRDLRAAGTGGRP